MSILIAITMFFTSVTTAFPGFAADSDGAVYDFMYQDMQEESDKDIAAYAEGTQEKEEQQSQDNQDSKGTQSEKDAKKDSVQEKSDAEKDSEDKGNEKTDNESQMEKSNPEVKQETENKKINSSHSTASLSEENDDHKDDLPVPEALQQAKDQGVDLTTMKEGETVTFKAMAGSTTKRVSVTRGAHYEYSAYGLGSYETYKYYVTFGNISATAYCVEPSKSSPDSGTYTITKLSDGRNLAKVCYYGTKASGEAGFFSEKHSGFSEGKRFILVHLAASYANGGSDAFSGANSTAKSLAMELYNWCVAQPDIPDVDMSFSDDDVTAYVEDGRQRTKEIRFKADELQTITFHLPDGVKLHNVSTGKTSAAGADVEITGKTVFYLSAPLTQAVDVKSSWSTTMKGSIVKDFSAYKISIGNGKQDLALVFGEGVDDEKYIDFKVSWISLGELTIYKEGEELTSVTTTADGATFHYEKEKQKNAVYNVYAGEDIKDGTGKIIYKEGALVAGSLKTDGFGSVTLKNLYAGTYIVTEKTAPSGFYNKKESKKVTVKYSANNSYSMTFVNARQKAGVSAVKQDKDTYTVLKGAVFGLYAGNDIKNSSGTVILKKDSLIEKAATEENGKASFQADLPLGYSYYIKELKAPRNYYRNQTDSYTFRFTYSDDQHEKQTFSHTFSNDRTNARIKIIKKDKETGEYAQGDAVLSGAVYGLYAREDIVHPDGKTGVMYKAGERIAVLTTNQKGMAEIGDLYLGKYYVKELSPSVGYLIDEEEYDVIADYEGDLVRTVERTAVSLEMVIKQPFQVIKAADNGKTDADLLEGAGFTAYLLSSLKKGSDGEYDYSSSKPVILTEGGGTELFTDNTGHAVSIALPYGAYIVLETTTPHNYKPVDPFIVRITENHPDTPQVWRILLDDEFKAKLKIIKQDDETGRAVLLPDTEFKVYDLDHQAYVNQTTTYPKTKLHTSYFTNEEGYLILPQNLKPGNYRIEEVHAPEGYTLNKDYARIKVDTDTMHHIDTISGDAIIEVIYENHPVKGELIITKTGKAPVSFDGQDFHYKQRELAGAEFEIYSAEDIFTPDYHRDINGARLVAVPKDSLVMTITSGENGKAIADNLPLGKYYVKERQAPDGYCINLEQQGAEFIYAGQETPVVKQEMEFSNERQKVDIAVKKRDARTNQTVAGAQFGIYCAEDIISYGTVIATKDTLLQNFSSDKEGRAVCTLDLPLGKYYVKEIQAPPGYILSDEVIEFDASYQGQNIEVAALESELKNTTTAVEFSKSDITTGIELSGAKLSVTDNKGHVIESWVSVKGKPHMIHGLVAGDTYILREELAPYGYLKATQIEFTVSGTNEVQKVEMKDEVPMGMLIINKKGEFLSSVSLVKHVKGLVEHLFEYISGNLADVRFELYAAEDIKAADGTSPDYYKKDDLITTITTDSSGYASVRELPLGKYYVKETGTAYGHILDENPRIIDLTYRNQDTPLVVYDKDWLNNRQKVSVSILKVEQGTKKGLKGGIFGLFARKPIYSSGGKELMEADEIIELKTTDKNGRITFTADLPLDAEYYVKELYAPPGYTTAEQKQSFNTKYQGEKTKEQEVSFIFEDEPTTIEITKSDLTNGRELPGAGLKITDKSGKTVDSWISTSRPHIMKGLIANEKYTLTETKPADGYVTAESIQFIIKDTPEIQKVEMKDDVTKVQISKQDIAGEELAGAKLTILDHNGRKIEQWISTDKPHYIDMLPVGYYVLREEAAPQGYLVSEEVKFEVRDTAKVQHVKMTDKPKQPSKLSYAPKTGDKSLVKVWLTILILGLAGICGIFLYEKSGKSRKL